MSSLPLTVITGFGLEAVVSRELQTLGYEVSSTSDGRVNFIGDVRAICRTNLWLRSAERVQISIATFKARDFGELFDQATDLPWEQWLTANAAFPVQGRLVRSNINSGRETQRILKKAIVERLRTVHKRDWFEEDGPVYPVDFLILKDQVFLTIDTSGPGLHKRGYRKLTATAPLRESLAAAIIQLSVWNHDRPFIDPCCGSGTLPIEAALIATNRAPGLNREFGCCDWPQIDPAIWNQVRQEARDLIQPAPSEMLIGTDIDSEVLSLARYHAKQAGVGELIHFQQKPLDQFSTHRKYGCVITNPPYGERLGTVQDAEELYRSMGRVFASAETWSHFILTAYADFETQFGRQATRRRKLYNARLACTLYQFLGPRPPRPVQHSEI